MRFSLSTMLVITAYAAVACMALVQPDFHWTSLAWNFSMIVLVIATVGALVKTGRDRAYWVGFAVAGWTHYTLTLGPLLYGRVNSYIFTRPLLDFVCVLLEHERAVENLGNQQMLSVSPYVYFFINATPTVKTYVYFLIAGFSVCSVLCGLLGGWLAYYLYGRANPSDSETPAT